MMNWSTQATDDIFLISDSADVRRHLSSSTHEMRIHIPSQNIAPKEIFQLISMREPRVVIVDLSFRGESGSQLIRRISARQSSPLILAVGADPVNRADQARRSLIAGATGYLSRAELSTHLERAVRRMSAGEIFLSDETKKKLHSPLYA